MTSTTGNMIKAAKSFGTGALISRKASRQRFAPITANLAPFNDDSYYGLGILVSNGWKFQNPELNGYTAIAGYLPSRRMSLAIVVTKLMVGRHWGQLQRGAVHDDHPLSDAWPPER